MEMTIRVSTEAETGYGKMTDAEPEAGKEQQGYETGQTDGTNLGVSL